MRVVIIVLTVAIVSVFAVGCKDVSKSNSNVSGDTCEHCRY